MDPAQTSRLRDFMRERLAEAGNAADFHDDSSLFLSGRLDSLALTRVVVFLEEAFGIDFAQVNFDAELVDSVRAMQALVDELSGPGAR
jgi:acyl carrier protein